MRLSLFSLFFVASLANAAPPAPEAFAPVFELAGIRLLCDQSAPLVQRGMDESQHAALGRAFAADALCLDLAKRLTGKIEQVHLDKARELLDSPLARRFTEAERAVGETGGDGLAEYRAQLVERPPRQDRLELVRRLDAAAHTTVLATLLRYEVGKTQALLALRARGESLDEETLGRQTQAQADALRVSSAQAVESFMLYAYRQMPSDQLTAYAELYEQIPVARLLESSAEALPGLFAERRAALK